MATRGRWIPIAVGTAFWIGLPALGFAERGRTGLEKVLTAFAMPVGLIWSLLLFVTLWQWFHGRLNSAILSGSFVLLLGIAGNGHIGGLLCLSVEAQREPKMQTVTPFDAVVLLGGSTKMSPSRPPELSDDGQRLFYAAQLYHLRKTPKIIATGGEAIFSTAALEISAQSRVLLESVGVPKSAIVEIGGVNTREEMKHLRSWLDGQGAAAPERVGLITSAAHLPRAMRLADRQGLSFHPLPCAFRGGLGPWAPTTLIPTVNGLESTTVACYELLAAMAGQ